MNNMAQRTQQNLNNPENNTGLIIGEIVDRSKAQKTAQNQCYRDILDEQVSQKRNTVLNMKNNEQHMIKDSIDSQIINHDRFNNQRNRYEEDKGLMLNDYLKLQVRFPHNKKID